MINEDYNQECGSPSVLVKVAKDVILDLLLKQIKNTLTNIHERR